jgi:hypothetical protein
MMAKLTTFAQVKTCSRISPRSKTKIRRTITPLMLHAIKVHTHRAKLGTDDQFCMLKLRAAVVSHCPRATMTVNLATQRSDAATSRLGVAVEVIQTRRTNCLLATQ